MAPVIALLRPVRLTRSVRKVAVLLVLLLVLPLRAPRALAHEAADVRIEDLTRRIAADPQRAELYLRRAELHRLRGELKAAEEDCRLARATGAEADADRFTARLLLESNRGAEAIPLLDRVLAVRPGDAEAVLLRARSRQAVGDGTRALADFDAAVRAAGNDGTATPDLYEERAKAAAAAGLPPGRIVAGLDEGIARLGSPASLMLEALRVEADAGHVDAALRRLAEAPGTSLPPLTRDVWRARLLESAGRRAEATAAWRQIADRIAAAPPARRKTPAVQAIAAEARRGLSRDPAGEAAAP